MDKRASGILLHITSLFSKYGIGDLGPGAFRFADFLDSAGQSFWQILPLNPVIPGSGYSPYFSSSAFAGNPLLISPEVLLEEKAVSGDGLGAAPDFPEGEVDYGTVSAYKMKVLDAAYDNFMKTGNKDEYEAFCSANSAWLDDFTLFCALKEASRGKVWSEWPEKLRDRDAKALKKAREKYSDCIGKEKFFQYLFNKQWFALKNYCNGRGIKIIGDLPIYVSYDSADVWVNPSIFKLDENRVPYAVSGVPPDYFSETGQLWNNPVYRWDVLKETGYRWWIERFKNTFSRFDMVRIDHFRGLVQYWEVPAGEETAVNGAWRDVPVHDFFDTLLKNIPGFPVIAEDLGIITPDVNEVKDHYGFPGMKVLLFAFGENNPAHPYLPHNYGENCIVYTGTHDNNTLTGWIRNEAGEEDKKRLSRYLDKEIRLNEVNWDMIRLAMMSVARYAIFPVQDILGLGSGARMNQPSEPFGNWKWRLRAGQPGQEHLEKLRGLTETYGRAKTAGGHQG
ncbi:MAG: 4-alpha-glucanotransferase [Candidatus Omnitrophota bacterium]